MKFNLKHRGGWLGFWPKCGVRAILDPENARIQAFLEEQAEKLAKNVSILDAGAGECPYRPIFQQQEYQSTDMPGGFYATPHDFECFLDDITKPNNTYDALILTQVLEHVPDPWKVLQEIHRVLKPGGRLLLSVPLTAPLHGEPWHFYHFTHHALSKMAEDTGFSIEDMEKVGGAFWVMGKRLPSAFIKLFKQNDPFRAKKRGQNPWYSALLNILMIPLYLFGYLPSAYILRPLFYWLDALDHEKSFTLGYTLVMVKNEINEKKDDT